MDNDINANIQNIEINILTNIPNNTTPIKLTKDIIYIPNVDQNMFSTFSSTPFIANNVEYNESELTSMSYIKIITTFFKRTSFEEYLKNKNHHEIIDNDLDNENKLNKILNNNVIIMLKALFPSVFPFTNNVDESFSSLIQNIISPVNFSLVPRFSYLKINNATNTVTNAVWLNDILNHPEYFEFLKKFYAYLVWADNEKKEIEKSLNISRTKFINKFDNYNKRPIEKELTEKINQLEASKVPNNTNTAIESKILSLKEIQKLILAPINENIMFNDVYYLIFYNRDTDVYWIKPPGFDDDDAISGTVYFFARRSAEETYEKEEMKDKIDFKDEDEAVQVDDIDIKNTFNKVDILLYLGKISDENKAGKIDSYINRYAMRMVNNNLTTVQEDNQQFFFICRLEEERKDKFRLNIIRNFNPRISPENYEGINKSDAKITVNKIITIDRKSFFERAIIITDELEVKKKPVDEKLKIFNKIDTLIRSVTSYNNISQGFGISESSFLNLIKEFTDLYSLVKMSLNFNNKYLICNGDNLSSIECIRLDVNDKTEWSDKFKIFKDTIVEYKKFMNEKTKTSNTYLQKLIDDYGNNQSGGDKGILNNFIIKTYEENIEKRNTRLKLRSNYSNLKHIGVSNVNFGQPSLPSYKIYVSIDLLGGEINNENVAKIQCGYDDEELVSRWKNIIVTNESPWKKSPYPYVQLDELIKNSPPNPISAVANKIIPSSNATTPKVGGKRSKRRKKNTYRRKTRKNKFISFY